MTTDVPYQQRVLVVDDDSDLAEITADCLQDFGLLVQTAFTVPKAKQEMSKGSFDYLITDLSMPDGGGLELIHWVQSQALGNGVGLVIVSGHVDFDRTRIKGTEVQMLPKPYTRAQLQELCDKMKKFRGAQMVG